MKSSKLFRIAVCGLCALMLAAFAAGCGSTATAQTPGHLEDATYQAALDAQTAAQSWLDGKQDAQTAVAALDTAFDTLDGLAISDGQKSSYNALISIAVDALRYDITNSTADDVQKDLNVLAEYLAGPAPATDTAKAA